MELFGVAVNRDDTVRVVSVPVIKETGKSYFVKRPDWETGSAFGMRWVERFDKGSPYVFTSARAAVEAYMRKRQADKSSALSVAGQATKQIASANELLMHLPESTPATDAVDPSATDTGNPPTRD